jgi:hypothetical protein
MMSRRVAPPEHPLQRSRRRLMRCATALAHHAVSTGSGRPLRQHAPRPRAPMTLHTCASDAHGHSLPPRGVTHFRTRSPTFTSNSPSLNGIPARGPRAHLPRPRASINPTACRLVCTAEAAAGGCCVACGATIGRSARQGHAHPQLTGYWLHTFRRAARRDSNVIGKLYNPAAEWYVCRPLKSTPAPNPPAPAPSPSLSSRSRGRPLVKPHRRTPPRPAPERSGAIERLSAMCAPSSSESYTLARRIAIASPPDPSQVPRGHLSPRQALAGP